jgi:hypothetical protein
MVNAGEFIDGPPPRGVLHTTEGSSYAGARSMYEKHRSAPHFTVEGRDVYQHAPMNRAARALKPGRGDVETNRWSAFQIEVVARAENPDWSWETKESTRLLTAWIESQTGIEPREPEQGFAATAAEAEDRRSLPTSGRSSTAGADTSTSHSTTTGTRGQPPWATC